MWVLYYKVEGVLSFMICCNDSPWIYTVLVCISSKKDDDRVTLRVDNPYVRDRNKV